MEAVEAMALLDRVERGLGGLELQHRTADAMVAGGAVEADAAEIDRAWSWSGADSASAIFSRSSVSTSFSSRPRRELAGPHVERAELVAREKNRRPRAFAAGGREVIADAEVAGPAP